MTISEFFERPAHAGRIDEGDDDLNWQVGKWITHSWLAIGDAAAAVVAFQEARQRVESLSKAHRDAMLQWQARTYDGDWSGRPTADVHEDVEGRRQVAAAHSFVLALWQVHVGLEEVKSLLEPRLALDVALERFRLAFPDLKGLRDSIAHPEDRVQRLAGPPGRRKSLDGALFIDSLSGDSFSTVVEQGHVGGVEITFETVRFALGVAQEVRANLRFRIGGVL